MNQQPESKRVPLQLEIMELRDQLTLEHAADARLEVTSLDVRTATALSFIPTRTDIELKLTTSTKAANLKMDQFDDYTSTDWGLRVLNKLPIINRYFGYQNRFSVANIE